MLNKEKEREAVFLYFITFPDPIIVLSHKINLFCKTKLLQCADFVTTPLTFQTALVIIESIFRQLTS